MLYTKQMGPFLNVQTCIMQMLCIGFCVRIHMCGLHVICVPQPVSLHMYLRVLWGKLKAL